ncbi:alanine dehydrogenase [Rickettsiales bacterium LUAb2]
MLIGVPKEIKNNELRVGLNPNAVSEFVKNGHKVLIETNLGDGIQATDADYIKAGAEIVKTAAEVYSSSEMIIKVKEPQDNEIKLLKKDQILFTYLHLAASSQLTEGIQNSGCTAIAYETVTDRYGRLPLLTPMSEVAGRLSVQMGANYLLANNQGKGLLIGGVPGVAPATVVLIGAGIVGENALSMAVGLGARVIILDTSLEKLRQLDLIYGNRITTLYSNSSNIEDCLKKADIVISSVLIPGEKAPKIITKEMLKLMQAKSVIVDVAIDQGGSLETSKATTHKDPIYIVDNIIHYCVANIPGVVAKTSSYALNNVVTPFALQLANKGVAKALSENEHLLNGLNIYNGKITNQAVAHSLNKEYTKVSF